MIQRNPIQPGACWPFQGFPGYLLIKLRNFIYVTGFTIEHVAKSILPSEKMESAPRKFNVWVIYICILYSPLFHIYFYITHIYSRI